MVRRTDQNFELWYADTGKSRREDAHPLEGPLLKSLEPVHVKVVNLVSEQSRRKAETERAYQEMSVWDSKKCLSRRCTYDHRSTAHSQSHNYITHCNGRATRLDSKRCAPSIGTHLLDLGCKSSRVKALYVESMCCSDLLGEFKSALVEISSDDGTEAEGLATVDSSETDTAHSSHKEGLLAALEAA